MIGAIRSSYGALMLFSLAIVSQIGCATYYASKMPGPKNDEAIRIGMSRSEVETLLAVGAASQYQDRDGVTVRYDYGDGPHEASKARVVLYIAGDVFTAFLSELVFWPIEAYATNRTKRVGTAHFDRDNRLSTWRVTRPSGELLASLGTQEDLPAVSADPPAVDPEQ